MIEKKQNKIDKYENLIKTKNMYKDLWKNLKNKFLIFNPYWATSYYIRKQQVLSCCFCEFFLFFKK